MNTTAGVSPQLTLHEIARRRFLELERKPLFFGDWRNAVFIHYEIAPEILQPHVPFKLDLRDGKAYVSLVAFTMERLRPAFGGRMTECLFKPIARHHFLNVRTYVRHHGEPGIYFIAEWLSNRIATELGPITYGLPYRYARMEYVNDCLNQQAVESNVTAPEGEFSFRAECNDRELTSATKDSLAEFLLERYTAYTRFGGRYRRFRIWHEPWQQKTVDLSLCEDSLINCLGNWYISAKYVCANVSPGVRDVWMSRPNSLY